MRILYDYQILNDQKYGGISRYYFELISRLEQYSDCEVILKAYGCDNYYFRNYKKSKMDGLIKKLPRRLVVKINQYMTLGKLQHKFDVIHPTYYNNYILAKHNGKLIITVYDMIHEIFRGELSENVITNKRNLILESDHIIAISDSTKRDILRFYPEIDQSKISVIYIASNMQKNNNLQLRSMFPAKYVLFVGQRKGYKNFKNFCVAVKDILKSDNDLEVVCTGGGSFSEAEIESFEKFKNRFHQINCDDELLSAAYTFAECFVFPSKYEGFGIPTLEAFACDCPVVLSNSSSMPEIGGDAVEYCDPNSIDSIRVAISRVLEAPDRKRELILKGREQIKKFDWDTITEQTLDCYRKVIEANGHKD